MKKGLIITASALIAVGILLIVLVSTIWGSKIFEQELSTKTVEITEDFASISVDTDEGDVLFKPSNNGKCVVEFYTGEKNEINAFVSGGVLKIGIKDKAKWYERLLLFSNPQRITVYLPGDAYSRLAVKTLAGDVTVPDKFTFESIDITASTGDVNNGASTTGDVNIKTSTGNINMEKADAKNISLSASTGDIKLKAIECEDSIKINVSTGDVVITNTLCKNFSSTGSTGSVVFNTFEATDKLFVKRSTGSVWFDKSDAGEIKVKTSTGDVTGTLKSEKVFITDTSTGDINVPKTVKGGRCEISTSTGDISIKVLK